MVYRRQAIRIRVISKSKKTGKSQIGLSLPQQYKKEWLGRRVKLIINEKNKTIALVPVENIV